jgi:hypothetical protein
MIGTLQVEVSGVTEIVVVVVVVVVDDGGGGFLCVRETRTIKISLF